jgi:hypothetical protein
MPFIEAPPRHGERVAFCGECIICMVEVISSSDAHLAREVIMRISDVISVP